MPDLRSLPAIGKVFISYQVGFDVVLFRTRNYISLR